MLHISNELKRPLRLEKGVGIKGYSDFLLEKRPINEPPIKFCCGKIVG